MRLGFSPCSLCVLYVLFDLWVRVTWLVAIIWDIQVEMSLKLPPALNTIQRERGQKIQLPAGHGEALPRLFCMKYVGFPPYSTQRNLSAKNQLQQGRFEEKPVWKEMADVALSTWRLLFNGSCCGGDIWTAGWCHQGVLRKNSQRKAYGGNCTKSPNILFLRAWTLT